MPFDRSVIPLVALEFMNRDHQSFMQSVDELEALLQQAMPDHDAIARKLAAILEHTRTHFAAEEAEMAATGFPPMPVHQSEHVRVLSDMERQAADWQVGQDVPMLLRYVRETIPAWLAQHTQTMDFVTANWVASRKGS
jgi:hemerythrin-like metal-binding protein